MTHTNCSGFCRFDDPTDHRFEPIPREHWDSDWMVGVSLRARHDRAEEKGESYADPEVIVRWERGVLPGRAPWTEGEGELTREEMCEWLIRDRDDNREWSNDPSLDYGQMTAYVPGKSLGSPGYGVPEHDEWIAQVDSWRAEHGRARVHP